MIYFIETTGNVKIGYSNDPKRRVSSLSTGCPTECTLIAVMDGGPDVEAELHNRFASLRVRGEWFKMSDEIRSFITESARPVSSGKRGRKCANEFERAIYALGGLNSFATALGIDNPSVIANWRTRGRVPAERVLDVERVTGISRHDLRPDIFGRIPEVTS